MTSIGLDTAKLDGLAQELEDAEKQARDIKFHIETELFENVNDAIGQRLISINWEAIRKRRFLRRQ